MTVPNGSTGPDRHAAIERATVHAQFLAGLAAARAPLVDAYRTGGFDAAIALVSDPGDGGDAASALRRRRNDLALLIALADLAGERTFEATTRALSDFADDACGRALAAAFSDRAPGEAVRGFAVIALGKQGSRELNYSSDIDPVLIFNPETLPRRSREDPGEAAVRLARRWVDILSTRTADGYVLRVDLRLRPSPEATPIALPVDAAIGYYESQALAWEQAAFIRARTVAGDEALGARFLDAIQPFIWRRSMDFGQLRRIGDISARIRSHYADGQAFGPGFDLKRGRGGIREVEFFAQVQQLIHGGRDPALRKPATLDALAALADAGLVEPAVAQSMRRHYRTLRTIEHRLQMVDDRQTHALPENAAALDGVARLHGLAGGDALLASLAPVVADVAQRYGALLGVDAARTARHWPLRAEAIAECARGAGFADPVAVVRRVGEWRSGSVRVLRSAAAREALEEVLPDLMRAIGATARPDATLARFDTLICGLPSAINLFNLLGARSQLLATLLAVLDCAPALAADLAARPGLIEGLIDASVFGDHADRGQLAARMRTPRGGYEAQLDHVRRVVGEHRFALGVQLVEGARDALAVSRGYADIADAAIGALGAATVAEFEAAHGRVPGGELLVLALGRLGGRAMTHASDLDLILLFTGDIHAESDGGRPLGATSYFNRLGQRVIAALSVPTAAGGLYEVDVRLRPQGAQGPLVASLDAFLRYQREDAWTWEHMALTRARPVFGSAAARSALTAGIDEVLRRPRDRAATIADIARMRGDMQAHKPPAGPLDVKLIDGGLVDLEFALHATQLLHASGLDPRLNVALRNLNAAGLAPDDVRPAMDLMGRMLVALRLMAPDGEPANEETRARIAHVCGFADGGWPALLAAYDAARQSVRSWWQRVSQRAVI